MGEVLVDTSAWIEFFRNPDSSWGQAVDLLLGEGRVCTTPLIMVEVVSGAQRRSQFERLKQDFSALPHIDPPPTLWEEMMESRWQLKNRGFPSVSIPDLIIAHTAMAHGKAILTCDRDFERIQPILGFQLVGVSGIR